MCMCNKVCKLHAPFYPPDPSNPFHILHCLLYFILRYIISRGKGSRGPNAKTRLKNGDDSVRIPPSRRKRKVKVESDDGEPTPKKKTKQSLSVSEDGDGEKDEDDGDEDAETQFTKKVKNMCLCAHGVCARICVW